MLPSLLKVPGARLELAYPFERHPLKVVCLPVPPSGQIHVSVGGLEPPTLCLKGRCSTPELHTRYLHLLPVYRVRGSASLFNIRKRESKFNVNLPDSLLLFVQEHLHLFSYGKEFQWG